MKLATFELDGSERVGAAVHGGENGLLIVDLLALAQRLERPEAAHLSDMQSVIEAGLAIVPALDAMCRTAGPDAPECHPVDKVRLLAPLPRPTQLRDFSVFEAHLRDAYIGLQTLEARANGTHPPAPGSGAVAQIYRDLPLFYFSNRMNVAGPDVHLEWPEGVENLDFELEIAAVIGAKSRDLTPETADAAVFGYTLFNDISARDVQWLQMKGVLGPCKAKSYDNCNQIGPWIVTRDELPSIDDLRAEVLVNGEPWVSTSVKNMVHSFPEMIAFASANETIFPGEVMGSGTIGGCCGLEMDRWVKRGDVVTLRVEKIGEMICNF